MKNSLFNFNFSTLVLLLLVIGCKEKMPIDNGIYSEQIRLNQIGYYPQATKKAVIVNGNGSVDFQLINAKTKKAVYKGELSEEMSWELAGEKVQIADFSSVSNDGEYLIYIKNLGYSYPFKIEKNVLKDVFQVRSKPCTIKEWGCPWRKNMQVNGIAQWHTQTTVLLFIVQAAEKKGFWFRQEAGMMQGITINT